MSVLIQAPQMEDPRPDVMPIRGLIACRTAPVTILSSLAPAGGYGPFEIGLEEFPGKDPIRTPEETRLWPSGAGEFEFRSASVSRDPDGRQFLGKSKS